MTKKTKKKRLARIRRHTSSLPKISSYDTTSNVEDGSKYGEYICKFIHVLSTLCYLCSLFVLMMEINNFPVPILGFGLLLFKILVLDLFLSIMGKSRYWPKTVSRRNQHKYQYQYQYQCYVINNEEKHLAHRCMFYFLLYRQMYVLQQYLGYLRCLILYFQVQLFSFEACLVYISLPSVH